MTLRWSQGLVAELRVWSEKCYPYEGCGLLIGRFDPGGARRAERFHPLQNLLRQADRRGKTQILGAAQETLGLRVETQGQYEFVMDPEEFNRAALSAAKEDLDVVGVLHTHPDHPARPSATDAAQPLLAGWSNVIVKVDQGRYVEAKSWVRDEESQPFQEEPIELA